jgi:hypothetical protein
MLVKKQPKRQSVFISGLKFYFSITTIQRVAVGFARSLSWQSIQL